MLYAACIFLQKNSPKLQEIVIQGNFNYQAILSMALQYAFKKENINITHLTVQYR